MAALVGLVLAVFGVLQAFGLPVTADQADATGGVVQALLGVLVVLAGRRSWVGRRDAEVPIDGGTLAPLVVTSGLVTALLLLMLTTTTALACGSQWRYTADATFKLQNIGEISVSFTADSAEGRYTAEVGARDVEDVDDIARLVGSLLGVQTLGVANGLSLTLPDGTAAEMAVQLDPPLVRVSVQSDKWIRVIAEGLGAVGMTVHDPGGVTLRATMKCPQALAPAPVPPATAGSSGQ